MEGSKSDSFDESKLPLDNLSVLRKVQSIWITKNQEEFRFQNISRNVNSIVNLLTS